MSTTKKKLRGRLQKGRELRRLQGLALSELTQGYTTLRIVLEHPPDALLRVPIHRVLEHAPKMGKEGARKAMEASSVWPLDTLGGLSGEQRDSLLHHLPPRATSTHRRVKL